jgi:anaerobic magnesium-protoporphyrin IX monomethyl ester cyclase
MTDILFTHSYFLRLDPKEFRAMMPYPPLGTLYAASVARALGYSVALSDSMLAADNREFAEALQRHRPRVVVIYDDDFNYLTKMCLERMRSAAFTLAAAAKRAGSLVVVHGSDAVDHLPAYFGHGVDFVLCGEGEQSLAELLPCLFGGPTPPSDIRGLAFLVGGRITRTAPRDVLRQLDTLPFPARDLVDLPRYRDLWKKHHGFFSTNIVTTRGCPFHCTWCAKPLYGQVYNSRSPQNVVEEMLYLKQSIAPDHLWFCDDIFGLTPGWIEEFSERVRRADAVIPFKCLARVDLLLKGRTIRGLREAGCKTVWVGAESGSQKILDAMEKGTTVQQIHAAAAALKEEGIEVGFFLQYGYPGETREDIALTLQMVRDCRPDDIGISVSYPLPGTKFYAEVRDQLGEKHNWVDSQDLAMLFHGTYIPDFYRALHRVTHKKFRFWQGVNILRQTVLRPWEVTPIRLRRMAASAYHWATLPPVEFRMNALAHKSNPGKERMV